MRRNATLILVLALLVGSVVSFVVAERLKLEKSPVAGTKVDKVFSPVCHCSQQRARIEFRLRRADRLELSLLDAEGHQIRTLVHGVRAPKGHHVFFWDGRDNAGRLVLHGSYRPKVVLGRADRTIVLPNPIRVDTTPPRVAVLSVRPRAISPDGDGRGDVVRVRYRASERAHGLLLVNGRLRVLGRSTRPADQLQWVGRSPGGDTLPPGVYRLAVQVQDLAGNRSRRVSAGLVELRYIALRPRLVTVRPNGALRIQIDADARRIPWALRRGSSAVKHGVARRAIVFTAPGKPGRYVLTAYAGRHPARTVVIVRAGS